jgi:general stress protein YciG
MATNKQGKGGAGDKVGARGGSKAEGKGNESNRGNKQASSASGSQSGTSTRGFASMDPARQREIASEGGKAAHQKGTAHEFTSEEARRAGSMSHGNRQSSARSSGAASAGNASGTPRDPDKTS